MNVKELMGELEKCNPDAVVKLAEWKEKKEGVSFKRDVCRHVEVENNAVILDTGMKAVLKQVWPFTHM